MKEIKIFVTGIQYACPVNFIEFLEEEFKVEREITFLKEVDRLATVKIQNYRNNNLTVSSIMPVIYYDDEIQEMELSNCDGIVLILTILKEREDANYYGINGLIRRHREFCPHSPVVTLINNYWGGDVSFFDKYLGRFMFGEEINKCIFPNSTMFVTSLGKTIRPELKPNLPLIRKDGGLEVLNCLLDLIEKQNSK